MSFGTQSGIPEKSPLPDLTLHPDQTIEKDHINTHTDDWVVIPLERDDPDFPGADRLRLRRHALRMKEMNDEEGLEIHDVSAVVLADIQRTGWERVGQFIPPLQRFRWFADQHTEHTTLNTLDKKGKVVSEQEVLQRLQQAKLIIDSSREVPPNAEEILKLYPEQTKVRQLVEAVLAWDVPEGHTTIKPKAYKRPPSISPENPFRHDEFEYSVLQEALADHFPVKDQFGKPVGPADRLKAFNDLFVNLWRAHEHWRNLCLMSDFNAKMDSLIVIPVPDGPGAAIRTVIPSEIQTHNEFNRKTGEFNPVYHYNPDSRGDVVLDAVCAMPLFGLQLPLSTLVESKESGEAMLVHEFTHFITGNCPHNPIIYEGLAECGTGLYNVQYNKHWWDQVGNNKPVALYGAEHPGMNTGPASSITGMGALQITLGVMAGHMFWELLGDTQEERVTNFQHLVAASRPNCFAETFEEFLAYYEKKLHYPPNEDKWLSYIDKFIPGFEERFRAHPTAQQIQYGDHTMWLPGATNGQDPDKTPWGMVTSYNFNPNPRFGRVSMETIGSGHSGVNIDMFDMYPGAYKPHEFTVRVRRGDEVLATSLDSIEGSKLVHPRAIAFWYPQDRLGELTQKFSVDALLPDGTHKCIGDNFYIDEGDVRNWIRDDHIAKLDTKRVDPICKALGISREQIEAEMKTTQQDVNAPTIYLK